MSLINSTDNYQELFLNNIPLMDVRAPVEFNHGAFLNTENIPLLDDEQRHIIGKQYKDAGQDEAIELGLKLATPEIRAQRLKAWKQFVSANPDGYLYCFRGGLRSRTTQAWLKEQGVDYPLIKGGYKAMRRYLLDQLDTSVAQIPFVILSGLTGSGKTRVLNKTRYHVDLEGLANHRGSAFGRDVLGYQPAPIQWENELSIACLKYRHQFPGAAVLLEDEGRMIGRVNIPTGFYEKMLQAPRIILETSHEQRIQITRQDYITDDWPSYQYHYGEEAENRFSSFVLDSLTRIKKRLGGDRYQLIYQLFENALARLFETGESDGFDEGISLLLLEYYDPMYEYQLKKKDVEIVFKGPEADILEWVEQNMKNYR